MKIIVGLNPALATKFGGIMPRDALYQEIIAHSVSNNWDLAKLEWRLISIFHIDGDPETCLCGARLSTEYCILRNLHNNTETIVGSTCLKEFLDLPSDRIFECFKRIRQDEQKGLNIETINYAHENGWITDRDKTFSIDTMTCRGFYSNKQWAWRIAINNKIVRHISKVDS